MPTAKAAANIQYDILNKEDGAARDSNQNRLSRGPSDGVHFKGYLRLCIVLEKQGGYEEALELAQIAHNQGWNGNWYFHIQKT